MLSHPVTILSSRTLNHLAERILGSGPSSQPANIDGRWRTRHPHQAPGPWARSALRFRLIERVPTPSQLATNGSRHAAYLAMHQ